MFEISAATTVN